MRELFAKTGKFFGLVAAGWSIYLLSGVVYPWHSIPFAAIAVAIGMVLSFAYFPRSKKGPPQLSPSALDWVFMGATVVVCGYHAVNYEFYLMNPAYSTLLETVLGTALILLILEAARRAIGWVIPIMVIFMLLYTYFGQYFPGILMHRGYSHARVIEVLYLGTRSYAGTLTGIMTTVVSVFIIFGSVLLATGGGKTIIDIANLLGGRFIGGSAKIAVVASALFGTISGAAVANVATTGSFTIPMMKSQGYKNELAAAVEATASTGGQIMPPVMGAGAFIMAEILGIPYLDICLAATIPAILYFYGCGVGIHFEAVRVNLPRVPVEMIPKAKEVLNLKSFGNFLLPLGVLVYYLIDLYTPSFAAFMATIALLAVFLLTPPWRAKEEGRRLVEVKNGFVKAGSGLVELFCMIVCIQLIVTLISLTGIGIKFSSLIISFSGGILLLALFLTSAVALILGMGMPTTAAYLLAASVLARALTDLGVAILPAHLFIFFYATLSSITPPVCLAVYVAAGMAQANWLKVAWIAIRFALPVYLIPFYFVYSGTLLFQGSLPEILWGFVTATIGVTSLAAGTIGFFLKPTTPIERIIFIIAAGLLIHPGLTTDLIGFALLFAGLAIQKYGRSGLAIAQ